MGAWRLLVAVALSAAASLAAFLSSPLPLWALTAGAFVVLVPGLVLTQVLQVREPLLSLVVLLLPGPVGWVLLATLASSVGRWRPVPAVVVATGLLGALALALLPSALQVPEHPLEAVRHRFSSHLHDDLEVRAPGRHRGAFPSPYDG